MKRRIIISSITAFSIIGIILLCAYRYNKEKREIQIQIDWVFDYAVSSCAEKIMENQKEQYAISYGNRPSTTEKIVLESNDTTVAITKTDHHKSLTATQVYNKALQSYLFLKKAINPTIIDSIFREELHQNNYPFETAVRLTENKTSEVFDSNPDGAFYNKAVSSTPILCGLQEEVTLQGYAVIPFSYIYPKIKSYIFLIIAGGLIIIITLLIYHRYLVRKEISKREAGLSQYNLTPNITFDSEQCLIKVDNNKYLLTTSCAKLLQLFLNSPDYFITYEELEEKMWKTNDMKYRREQAIKRLRESLEQIPQLGIINVRGNGYKLHIEK